MKLLIENFKKFMVEAKEENFLLEDDEIEEAYRGLAVAGGQEGEIADTSPHTQLVQLVSDFLATSSQFR